MDTDVSRRHKKVLDQRNIIVWHKFVIHKIMGEKRAMHQYCWKQLNCTNYFNNVMLLYFPQYKI